jgi:hypothetical protein
LTMGYNKSMQSKRDITLVEWNKYEWVEVSEMGADSPLYMRGVEKTPKPNDGYVYEDWTKLGDAKQVWKRIQTIE